MLKRLTFWARAEAAKAERRLSRTVLLHVHCRLELFLRLEPRLWGVVHPRVEDGNGAANDAFIGAPLRPKSVQHIVFLLDAKHVHARLQVLRNQVSRATSQLLFLFVSLLRLVLQVVLECPEASLTE